MTMSFLTRTLVYAAAALAGALSLAIPAKADEFALSVSPPRFELSTQPGQTVRAVAELSNSSNVGAQLNFATAEWELTADGGVATSNALKPGSCRPWVAIERQQTVLQPRQQLRYRFEVAPPAGTPPMECRFAIIISSAEERVSPIAGVSFPVTAQIALIVYVAVGDVKPHLEIVKADVAVVNGVQKPVLLVKNTGQAHGRLAAFLTGTDAKGIKREFTPSTLPILAGETRMIALEVDLDGDLIEKGAEPAPKDKKADPIAYPLKMSGTINDSVSSFKFDGVFEP